VEENHTLRMTLKIHIISLRNIEIMVMGDLPHSASIISPHREKKTKETNIRKHIHVITEVILFLLIT